MKKISIKKPNLIAIVGSFIPVWVIFPGGGGDSHMEQTGMLVGILNLTPKGDHLGVAQAFCDP